MVVCYDWWWLYDPSASLQLHQVTDSKVTMVQVDEDAALTVEDETADSPGYEEEDEVFHATPLSASNRLTAPLSLSLNTAPWH